MAVMNKLRANMKTILLILVFAFIATIIFDWGMGGFQSGRPRGVIAEVDGEEISYDEFIKAYQQELKTQREKTGNDPQGYQLQQIENQIFERLVQQRLLNQVIDELYLYSTDDEVVSTLWTNPPDIIRSTPAFQDSTGNFDYARYEAALNNPELDQQWQGVIYYMQSTLPFQKLSSVVNATAIVTDDDARLEYIKNNVKARADYVFYDAGAFENLAEEPSSDDIMAYYKAHQDDFKQNEKRVLDYVLLEIKPSKADSLLIQRQVEDLLADARSGKDFAQLAEIYSADPGSAEKGGDLGYFKRGAMVKPFADAAFSAKRGEIVGPVQTQYGIHIIKVEDKRRQNGEDEVKARHILLKIEPSNSTREALRDEAEYLSDAAKESQLGPIAAAESLQVRTTPPFEIEGFIPGIGMERRVNRWAFRSQEGDVSDVISTDNGYLVVELKEIIPRQVQPLEEVTTVITNILKKEKRMQAAKAAAQAAYEKLAAGATLEQVAADDSLTLQQTDEFVLGRTIPGIGREPRFAGAVFKLGVGDFSKPIEGMRGYYILQVTNKTDFDPEDFEKQKAGLVAQLRVRKRNQMFSLWYAKLKDDATIKDYRNDFF